jgi:hypothetical protein
MSRFGKLLNKLRPTRKPDLARAAVDDGGIYDGTVGWEDGKSHYDLDDGEVPFIKVRLFLGHNPVTEGENQNPSRAAGRKIVARIDPKASDIPEDGETVIVAVPKGRSNVPGAAMIIGRPNPDPKWIPNRTPGEKIIFGPKNTFIRMKADGTIHLFTRDSDSDEQGKTVCFQVRPDGFVWEHPHMRITAGPKGYHAVHSSGARIDFGAIGGLPFPLDALSSMLKLSAGMVQIEASATAIGPSGGEPDFMMKGTPTLAAFSALEGALTGLATALPLVAADLATIMGIGVPSSVTPISSAVAAIGAAATAIGTLPVAAPTQSLTGA